MSTDEAINGCCVCCGCFAGPLYRRYGKHALRLTQCTFCGSVADKYIEYDPFIIIIDLVLLSTDAYRHVLYNTEFKAFWRMFLMLVAMETYVDWSNGYLSKHQDVTDSKNISDEVKISKDKFPDNMDEEILYEFGGIFICSLLATLAFIGIIFIFSLYFGLPSLVKGKVDYLLIWKAITLASIGKFLMLPVLIWGSDYDRSMHSILVFVYVSLSLIHIQSVIFQCSISKSILILSMSYIMRLTVSSNLRSLGKFLYNI
ncbi:ACAT-related protein required for viability 1 [Arctopsyche grandis]|uniref:ACAT-related protein required for viability 1 n=1 Tax=Arctopsyche grandis TaxID=121162 RepID=UPI00406D932B